MILMKGLAKSGPANFLTNSDLSRTSRLFKQLLRIDDLVARACNVNSHGQISPVSWLTSISAIAAVSSQMAAQPRAVSAHIGAPACLRDMRGRPTCPGEKYRRPLRNLA